MFLKAISTRGLLSPGHPYWDYMFLRLDKWYPTNPSLAGGGIIYLSSLLVLLK